MTRSLLALLTFAVVAPSSNATTITFEGFADSTILTNQYPGVTFTNAIILTSGVSLNEFEFPPHSGVNVVSDNGGPITIDFANPISNFSAYFTYAEPLTIQAFNASGKLVATTTSIFSDNEAISGLAGSSPNELESLSWSSGISSITITGDPNGGSLVFDDMSYSAATIPEPQLGPLLTVAFAALALAKRKKKLS